jgi:UDP-N-acetylmuramate--alanine ligase
MNVYFSCIAGVGIGPLAEIAKDAGYEVAGSDLADSLITKELQAKGIPITKNQDGSFLKARHAEKPIDWFVYSSALKEDSPELVMARKLGIKTSKRDGFLPIFIRDNHLKLIAVAGTHGKTTTTSMLVYTFQKLGLPVSYSIGTTLSFGPSGKYDPNSEYFIYECDEYDRNFLNYEPYLSLIPSVDYDHPDIYPTQQDYNDAFRQFAISSQQIITWEDQPSEIFDNLANVTLLKTDEIDQSSRLSGEHNRRNAALVKATLKRLGINKNVDEILANFPGSDRRFEKLAEHIYSDYGHHPVEIAATLQMAHELSNKVALIYQPHQNSRQYQIRDQYDDQVFKYADKIYWVPTYLTREDPSLAILTPKDLAKNINDKTKLIVSNLDEKLWVDINDDIDNGYLALFMGAGTIDNWLRSTLANKKY